MLSPQGAVSVFRRPPFGYRSGQAPSAIPLDFARGFGKSGAGLLKNEKWRTRPPEAVTSR